MKVGLLTLSYRLYSVNSIKEKRSILRHLEAEVRRAGPSFAVCELDGSTDLDGAVLRIAHVSNDARVTDAALTSLQRRIERGSGFEIVDAEKEFL
ncbi:MAG: DUF503 family protein [Candidatus Bipolaricaulis sp.]|nr:DUF503 family protein [Candidatus Bipolaricaulis sp.]MDD5220236.1 DUF503 family protein [Candidatus Bipolaricaulis sp.]MDD5646362.1 DUF503 family protein [Candidatus Bipolaricaulis sp.]